MAEPWFDENTFGALYGAIVGGGGGTLSGLWGSLAGTLAPQGKARAFVLGAAWVIVAFGLSQLAFGLFALTAGQPFGIWFFPSLVGVILTLVVNQLIPVVKQRYAEADARKMEAEALRRA
jgi:hypothetical protein